MTNGKRNPQGNSVQRNGHVLLVEPDDLIRELLDRWLRDAGYTVVISDCGTPARTEAPGLIIADIAAPPCGEALIRSLQSMYAAPVLVVSARFRRGLGASTDVAHRLGAKQVLPIPCTREELLGAVREAIDESS